jgi:hypothetical protein
MSALRRVRPFAACVFAFVVVPGITAAATMLGFVATVTWLHEGSLSVAAHTAAPGPLGKRAALAHVGEQGHPAAAP